MKDYEIIARQGDKTLLRGPLNHYMVVPTSKEEDLKYLEFQWGNGGTLDMDSILLKLLNLKVINL